MYVYELSSTEKLLQFLIKAIKDHREAIETEKVYGRQAGAGKARDRETSRSPGTEG